VAINLRSRAEASIERPTEIAMQTLSGGARQTSLPDRITPVAVE
jgi:hypothetical protein